MNIAAPPPSTTIMRGSKIRLYPNQRQADLLDLWRRRCLSLWNLLLSLEQAAYSGENTRSKLGWRSIWAQVVKDSHDTAIEVFKHGKQRRDGTVKRAAGEGREPPPLDPLVMLKIRRLLPDDEGPKLFIWEHELQKVMARLKNVPKTQWITALPSHAAQAVVKDLIKALQAMLRERAKRASGAAARDTGFPRFKKSRYANGSVYFANTQLKVGFANGEVQFPNGCGTMRCELPNNIPATSKLMGGRAWRQGEEWFLSCQWEMARPAPLPRTGRTAGVKIAASVLLTTYDNRGQTREYVMPPPDPKLARQHKRAGQKLARALEAQKRRERKLLSLGRNVKPGKAVRLQRSGSFYQASARLANLEAHERDRRDDFLHKLTTDVVRQFDAISVQKMDVASMMRKPSVKRIKRHRAAERPADDTVADDAQKRRRPTKPIRKLLRHVAMARTRQLLEYKCRDLGRLYIERPALEPEAQTCSRCGTVRPEMKDGRRTMRCDELLGDGSICGNVLPRNRNAARNAERPLKLRRKATEQAKE